ncbi:long-chain-fatty-acid--CoA ligase [Celeribacter indicus]|uniref:Long-chain-fatty-acid--CoA ligase n=3 Tax=Celeribacter indicus TaxID=1208324 RepID=A0A0B5DN65_9RHOB|nr:long-chain-fatty-acid--CoA ligase [Celeribacter indicus]
MIRFYSGERCLARTEMEDFARRAASGLADMSIGRGAAVALLMVNELEMIACTQALATLGAYSVPINWRSTVDEVAYIVADAEVSAIVVHDALLPVALEAAKGRIPVISVPLPQATAESLALAAAPASADVIGWDDWIAAQSPWAGKPEPARPAIIYTSGTTGKPKGVVREAHASDAAKLAQARQQAFLWGAEDGMRTLLLAPLYHAAPAAYLRSALGAMKTDGEVHLTPRFDPETVLRIIQDARISHMWMVPTMFIRLLQLPADVRARYDVSSLRNVVHSAAPCPVDVKLKMIEWFGPVVNEFYGSTETGPLTYVTSPEYLARPGTAGRVIDGCTIAILDDDGNLLPPGTDGEIAGTNSAFANFTYRNRQGDRDSLNTGGLIRSGDIGCIDDDGYLFVKDRKKDMVISGGSNIYPAEIESVLLALSNIADGAVFGVPHPVYGESLMAAVTLQRPEPGAPDRLRADLAKVLSPDKLPRKVLVVEDFPRDPSGKVFKHKLRKMVAESNEIA